MTLQNVTLKFCIQQAYSAKEYQVAGPGWITKARYDIKATLAPGTPIDQIWPALQVLLAERLNVSLRRGTKELLLYAMTVAKNGPKMRPVSSESAEGLQFQQGGRRTSKSHSDGDASGSLQLRNATLTELCDRLSRSANHPVVDRTGVTGRFDFDLQFSGSSSSTMSKALERQLGLKLEPTKDTVEMLVLENALRKRI